MSRPYLNMATKTTRLFKYGFIIALLLTNTGMAHPDNLHPATIKSVYAAHDAALDLNPASPFWRDARPIVFEKDNYGRPVTPLRTEVRSRWTPGSLYLLFICPYENLYLKPSPQTKTDTNQLWNWDVAEAFIGSDFQHIRRYKEFELSPQGEWIDLDVDLDQPHRQDGWRWNSGFETAARIDHGTKTWYGAMHIPFTALSQQVPQAGSLFRVNFFRCQGTPPDRHLLAWQTPMGESFHVPERFGRLELVR